MKALAKQESSKKARNVKGAMAVSGASAQKRGIKIESIETRKRRIAGEYVACFFKLESAKAQLMELLADGETIGNVSKAVGSWRPNADFTEFLKENDLWTRCTEPTRKVSMSRVNACAEKETLLLEELSSRREERPRSLKLVGDLSAYQKPQKKN